jgi:hypothetical protein
MLSFGAKVPRDKLLSKNKSTFSIASNKKLENEVILNTT